MLHVEVRLENQTEVARIDISRVELHEDGSADYVANIGVERGDAVGVYSRVVHRFPRDDYNALALVYQVLSSLDSDAFGLDRQVSDCRPMGIAALG